MSKGRDMTDSLINIIKQFLEKNPVLIEKDQYFLMDKSVIDKFTRIADINKEDRVLEVGPGLGFLTMALAKKAKEVIAIEIDERFKPYLNKLPKNVEIIYGDAYKLLNNREFLRKVKPPTKTVSNIPYSQAQNMLHNYTNSYLYQGDLVWIAPLSLVNKINKEPILGAYFKTEVKEKIPKSAFYPEPNTTSAIIHFKRIPDPLKTENFGIYLRRWLYNHEDWKVKNALKEGIIKAAFDLKNKKITKNQAKGLIKGLQIPDQELDKLTNNIRPEYYFEIPVKLQGWFDKL